MTTKKTVKGEKKSNLKEEIGEFVLGMLAVASILFVGGFALFSAMLLATKLFV